MSRTYSVEVDGVVYAGQTASAKAQLEALHLSMQSGVIASLKEGYSDMGVVTTFAALKFEDLQKLASLVMGDLVKRDEDDVPVAPNLFSDNIHNYYLLLHHVLRENIGGFWKLRRPEGQATAGQPH